MSDPLTAAREALARPWWHPECGSIVDAAHLRAALHEADTMRAWAERAAADENANGAELAALRIEHEAHAAILTATRADRDRLRDVLRCERGEWAPEGWRWFTDGGFWRRRERLADVTRLLHAGDGWELISGYKSKGEYPTALEAIEAADLAAGSKP